MKKKTILLLITLLMSVSLFSQYSYFYGKNKVIKRKFEWKIAKTKHFNIHFYTKNKKLIEKIAVKAEAAYKKLSLYLNVNAHKIIPIVYYNTHIDFEMTNLFPGFMPLGIQAFAEPIGHRVVIHGDRPFDDFAKTLAHELGHIFEYLVWYGNTKKNKIRFGRQPLWVPEGFSEFISSKLEGFNKVTVIDNVITDRIPELSKNNQMTAYTNRTPYDFGRVMFEFIDENYGAIGVKKTLKFFKKTSLFKSLSSSKERFFKMFGVTRKEFNFNFKKYLRKRFSRFMGRENPDEYSYNIGPEFPYAYSFGIQISPSGEVMAILTYNIQKRKLEIILISMKTGEKIKSITPGFISKYDGIDLKFNPTDGISFAWDNKSEKIAFFARKEFDNYLVVIDVLSTKIEKFVKLKDIQSPSSPDFHPTNQKLYFTGINDFRSSIFSYNFTDGKFVRLTHGKLYIKSLNLSNDGKKIVYSGKLPYSSYNLFLAPIEAIESPMVITDSKSDDITPSFSVDSKKVYYSSNEMESYNLYSIDLENKKKYRHTNVKTGNFFPTEIPGEKNMVAFTSFYKGLFYLYKKNVESFIEESEISFETYKKPLTEPQNPELAANKAITKFDKYSPLKDISITGSPSVILGMSTRGDFAGYTSITATDVLGDMRLNLTLGSFYGYRNFSLTYINLKRRLQVYTTAFSMTMRYYTQYSFSSDIVIRKRYGFRTGAYLPFNRSHRLEIGFSAYKQEENTDLLYYGVKLPYGQYFTGNAIPLTLSLIGDSIYFSNRSPNRGSTFKISISKYIKLSDSFMDASSASIDYRKYISLGPNTTLAFRVNGAYSGGKNPVVSWTGGNNSIRSAELNSIVGTRLLFVNLELRFPIIHVAATPIGLIGPIKGVFFFDAGGAWFKEQEYDLFEPGGGLRLKDGLASYGFGLQVNMFGYPLHFDWVYKTDFKENKYHGLKFWIGFDF